MEGFAPVKLSFSTSPCAERLAADAAAAATATAAAAAAAVDDVGLPGLGRCKANDGGTTLAFSAARSPPTPGGSAGLLAAAGALLTLFGAGGLPIAAVARTATFAALFAVPCVRKCADSCTLWANICDVGMFA